MLTLTAVFLTRFLSHFLRPLLIVFVISLYDNDLLYYPFHAFNYMLDNLLRKVVSRLIPVLLQLIMASSIGYVLFNPRLNLLYRIEIRRVERPIFAEKIYNMCPEEIVRVISVS
jgi:hypothetical protein